MIDPDETTEFNGQVMAIKDIPDPFVRAMLGYGHQPDHGRSVIEGEWPWTPDTCLYTGPTEGNQWIKNDTVLVCTGCGLDVT